MFDRRASPRYPCQWHATLVLTGARRCVTILDLSMEGALVRPAGPQDPHGLAVGARCAIRILAGDDRELLMVPATVAHAGNGLVGLALRATGCGAERMLRQLIEFNLGIGALARRDARTRQYA